MQQWVESVEDELTDLMFEIDQKQQVFQFNKSTGKLELGFSLRWESLLREVRQVGALGLPIPSQIQKSCSKAAKLPSVSRSDSDIIPLLDHMSNTSSINYRTNTCFFALPTL